jgi:hypothetical protein
MGRIYKNYLEVVEAHTESGQTPVALTFSLYGILY